MIRTIAVTSLAMMLSLGVFRQESTPVPDDGGKFGGGGASATVGCEGIADYQEALFGLLNDHDLFAEYWNNPSDTGELQAQDIDELQAVVDDGRALIEEMNALEVPETYAKGHEGITLLFDSELDVATFLGIDASDPIDYDQYDRGLALIFEGELLTTKACPDEMDEIGGYIFFTLESLEDYFQ
jgi:hypothetical protein